MARCPKCKGAGGKALFTSVEKCATCGGTGEVADDPPSPEARVPDTRGHDVVLRGGLAPDANHDIHLQAGHVTGSSSSETVTLTFTDAGTSTTTFTGGATVHTVAAPTESTLLLGTPQAPGRLTLRGARTEAAIVVGNGHPSAQPSLPTGSLYIRDDGDGASLWMKTGDGPAGWQALVGGGIEMPPGPQETELVRWTIERLREDEQAAQGDYYEPPSWMCGQTFPVMAPVFLGCVADLVAVVEQAGHEVHAFVTSCRDFADVRKWDDCSKIRWEGDRVWVFGVEVLRSAEMPTGYFAAVSRSGHACLASVIR